MFRRDGIGRHSGGGSTASSVVACEASKHPLLSTKTPWLHDGSISTGETYKNVVKMTFAKGAALKDPSGLFNSSLEGNIRRAIDFHEGEKIDKEALKTLVRAAVTLNKSTARS